MSSYAPAELARAALKRIAELRLPPTPENFGRYYAEAAGATAPRGAPVTAEPPPDSMIRRFGAIVDQAVATTEQLATGLQRHDAAMDESLAHLVRSPSDIETAQLVREVAGLSREIHATVQASQGELLETRRSLAQIKSELAESRKLLGQDPLTGTENRRAMDAILAREISRSRRDGEPLAVVMVDIDHFKSINDRYGHLAGDAALVHLTQLSKALLRGNDSFIRYGGEEFLLVLPETGLQGGISAGQRLQNMLRRQPFVHEGRNIPMTLSGGVSVLQDEDTYESLVRRADAALYRAKEQGRDLVLAGPAP